MKYTRVLVFTILCLLFGYILKITQDTSTDRKYESFADFEDPSIVTHITNTKEPSTATQSTTAGFTSNTTTSAVFSIIAHYPPKPGCDARQAYLYQRCTPNDAHGLKIQLNELQEEAAFNTFVLMLSTPTCLLLMDLTGCIQEHYYTFPNPWSNVKPATSVVAVGLMEVNRKRHHIFPSMWNIEKNKVVQFSGPKVLYMNEMDVHHDLEYNPTTNTFLLLSTRKAIGPTTDRTRPFMGFDELLEVTPEGKVVWKWAMRDHLTLNTTWIGDYEDERRDIGQRFGTQPLMWDLSHLNSVYWDMEENMIYINSRHLDTAYKINKKSGQLVWGLGRWGNLKVYDQTGKRVPSVGWHAHGFYCISREPPTETATGGTPLSTDTRFLLYNNNFHNLLDHEHTLGRDGDDAGIPTVYEIQVDEVMKEARVTKAFRFPKQPQFRSYYHGNAVRLPTNHTLAVLTNQGSLVVFDSRGSIVWAATLTRDQKTGASKAGTSSYKALTTEVYGLFLQPGLLVGKTEWDEQNQRFGIHFSVWNKYSTRTACPAIVQIYGFTHRQKLVAVGRTNVRLPAHFQSKSVFVKFLANKNTFLPQACTDKPVPLQVVLITCEKEVNRLNLTLVRNC